MKFLLDIFEKKEHDFEGNGKYAKWYPMYEAIYTFLFSSKLVAKGRVHVRDFLDTKRYMTIVLIALKPCLVFGIYN